MDILDLLRADGSIVVNKKLAKQIGLHEAMIYSELASMYKYWEGRGLLKDGEWFFCTIDNLQENTTLKKDAQSKAINKLEKIHKLIETKRMGLPARRYFKITNNIFKLFDNKFSGNPQSDSSKGSGGENEEKSGSNPSGDQIEGKQKTGLSDSRKLDFGKPSSNNTKGNNTKGNNTNLSIIERDIAELDIPIGIQKQMILNIDRLIDDSISIYSIQDLYNAYKDKLNEYEFSLILGNVLESTKEPIKNIKQIMMKSINNHVKPSQQAENDAEVSKEIIPDWFKDRNKKKETSYDTDYSQYDFNKRKNPDWMTEEQKEIEELRKKMEGA